MSIFQGWLPISRENWELIVWGWQFFPLFTAIQWMTEYYPMGKTSINSVFNVPGKYAWAIMESPGILIVLYHMFTLPNALDLGKGLPWGNWTMAICFSLHYIYRAWISPLFLNPSMSPIHPLVSISAFSFQVINGLSIGGWLAGHGPTTAEDWSGRLYYVEIGMMIWAFGLIGNMWHDDELREIRRVSLRKQREEAKKQGKSISEIAGVQKLYLLPRNGLFELILFPHFLCEWIEWAGYWMIGGLNCIPARTFLFNEIAAMLPRALSGHQWYIKKFGADKVGRRKAIIPGIL